MPKPTRGRYYILDGEGRPAREDDALAWARWFETADRTVAKTDLGARGLVSTAFLGLDHNWANSGQPILWETMVFGGPMAGYQRRYTSRKIAEAGHNVTVLGVMAHPDPAEPVRVEDPEPWPKVAARRKVFSDEEAAC